MATLEIETTLSLNYQVDGNGEHTILLFNGATLPLTFWGGLARRLAEHFTVIRFDQRNAGATVFNGEFTLNDTAADASAILKHLGVEQVAVVGHAWGGRAAQVFVRDYPHLARLMVICGTGGQFPPHDTGSLRDEMIAAARRGDRESWERCLAGLYCAPGFMEREPGIFSELADAAWTRASGKSRWNPRVSPSTSYWGTASIPTLLIYGDKDNNGTRENAEDLARRLPDSRLEYIRDAGHFAIREKEDRTLALLLDFIR